MKCTQIKDNGEQCTANAMPDGFCWFHSPNISAEEKRAAQVRGGQNNALEIREAFPVIEIAKPADAVTLLADTIKRVRAGTMDVRIANCIGVLAGYLVKAFETAQIDERMETIERVILEKRTKGIHGANSGSI